MLYIHANCRAPQSQTSIFTVAPPNRLRIWARGARHRCCAAAGVGPTTGDDILAPNAGLGKMFHLKLVPWCLVFLPWWNDDSMPRENNRENYGKLHVQLLKSERPGATKTTTQSHGKFLLTHRCSLALVSRFVPRIDFQAPRCNRRSRSTKDLKLLQHLPATVED